MGLIFAWNCIKFFSVCFCLHFQVPMGMFNRDLVYQVNITGKVGQYLDILVENQGRIGFGTNMLHNKKVCNFGFYWMWFSFFNVFFSQIATNGVTKVVVWTVLTGMVYIKDPLQW